MIFSFLIFTRLSIINPALLSIVFSVIIFVVAGVALFLSANHFFSALIAVEVMFFACAFNFAAFSALSGNANGTASAMLILAAAAAKAGLGLGILEFRRRKKLTSFMNEMIVTSLNTTDNEESDA